MGIPSDGDSVAVGNILITICPWWDGPNGRQAVENQLARDASKEKETWIWVYHAPPSGSPTSWDGKKYYGDSELTDWIQRYKPDIVFSGHIHQAPFIKDGSWTDRIGSTWVFNCGHQIGPTPTHIIVDTDARQAIWLSLAGAETVKLDQPLLRPLGRWSGYRIGSWLKAGIPIRARQKPIVLLVNQGLEDIIDHGEMIVVARELGLRSTR